MNKNKSSLPSLRNAVSSPTGLDSLANFAGQLPDEGWGVLVARNRDADLLSNSNFETALEQLGGEGENVEVVRIGHWACGWIEYLGVREGTPEYDSAVEIQQSLEDYPVLDEEDWSKREEEEAQRVWADCYTTTERIKYIREHRSQFEFRNFSDLLNNARGEYFSGYASELLA